MPATPSNRTAWSDLNQRGSRSRLAEAAYQAEARVAAFQGLVYRLRIEAGLTQAQLATRMGTTQSAIARMEGGGTRPTLETLEKLASAVGADLVIGVAENLSSNRSIAKLERDGRAVVRRAG
jgi:ribosome-binding protein aMBF1 (putative translation factor)